MGVVRVAQIRSGWRTLVPDVRPFLFFGAFLQSSRLSRASVLYTTKRNVLDSACDMLLERLLPGDSKDNQQPAKRYRISLLQKSVIHEPNFVLCPYDLAYSQ